MSVVTRNKKREEIEIGENELLLLPQKKYVLLQLPVYFSLMILLCVAFWYNIQPEGDEMLQLLFGVLGVISAIAFYFKFNELLDKNSTYVLLSPKSLKYTKKWVFNMGFELPWDEIKRVEYYETFGKNRQKYVRLILKNGKKKDFSHFSILPTEEMVHVIRDYFHSLPQGAKQE